MITGLPSGAAATRIPFPVPNFALPFRPVAGATDLFASRFNAAGLAWDTYVELGYLHQFARHGPGGDNALILRLKAVTLSAEWIEDAVYGNRQEYKIGTGYPISPRFSIGTTFRYLKADADALDGVHTWTHDLQYRPSQLVSLGLRWENAWHADVGGTNTDGTIIGGVAVAPRVADVLLSLDWYYPEVSGFDDSYLVLGARIRASHAVDLSLHVDTESRIGFEFRLMEERSAAGMELRAADPGGYEGGTAYISVSSRPYDTSRE